MKIEIPGTPIALKRPRFASGKCYDSQTHDKGVVRMLMRSNRIQCIDQYCKVNLIFCFSSMDNLELWGVERPTKSDLDNQIKWILDCGNGILWSDDRLIIAINAEKRYEKKACTIIEIHVQEIMEKQKLKILKEFSPSEVMQMRSDFAKGLDHFQANPDEIAAALIYLGQKWGSKLKKVGDFKL